MRAVVITRHGPPEVLQVQERPDPRPGPGEVLIDVQAAGINFADRGMHDLKGIPGNWQLYAVDGI